MLKIALAKFLTLKAAAVLAATAAGGVALAAGTGALPSFTDSPPATERAQNPDGSDKAADGPGAMPSPSLHGLCQAYSASEKNENVLSTPPFTALINAAGGAEQVPDFCANLPDPGNRPDGVPAGPAGTHPADASADHPNGASDDPPHSAPSAAPSRTGR